MAKEILKMENITKRFGGVTALKNVNIEIGKGEIVCLLGENGSGKSTMIKIISGVYTLDEGRAFINGKEFKKITPLRSINEGIAVIYQDFSLFPDLTVAENIAISEIVLAGDKLMNWKKMERIAEEKMARLGIHFPLDAQVGKMSAADRQLIAIAKVLLERTKLIIMDEPTTALSRKEIEALCDTIHDLKDQGISILFVSHKLNEVRDLAERLIILRNGEKVYDELVDKKHFDFEKVGFLMTGRHIDTSKIEYSEPDLKATPKLEVEHLTLAGKFDDVSFKLYQNEVLGITGLLGGGQNDLALALFGAPPADSGTIKVEGEEKKIKYIHDSVNAGFGYVPADRIRVGLFMEHSIAQNIVPVIIKTLVNKLGVLFPEKIKEFGRKWVKILEVKTPSVDLPANSLSGGNQQRLVLAKWMASDPTVLIMDGPTVGVDIGSKAEIHDLMRKMGREGRGVILISDDIPELIQVCNRILVMRDGKIIAEHISKETSEQALYEELVASGEPA
ncbi:MAG: sugar ABC transporter ATP-binding protein [Anaerolineaceae bacterium]|nr:sugar ABC transporter ATP-binding protein [Anaerolineaceae bacterium]